MSNLAFIQANTDMGVNIDGAHLASGEILAEEKTMNADRIEDIPQPRCMKSNDIKDKQKNLIAVNAFNQVLYEKVKETIARGYVPVTIGGDHSVSIGSALASQKAFDNLGIVWFDAHGDYNTFATTQTGNLHGMPFASITGQNENKLTAFFDGHYYDPKKCVLVGARSIDMPGEMQNIQRAGVTVFTTKDIQKQGVKSIFEQALAVVTNGTNGIHLSVDLDVIDPLEAPGVSVPEEGGITEQEFFAMLSYWLADASLVKSLDLVEYNPLKDINQKTLKIAQKALRQFVQ